MSKGCIYAALWKGYVKLAYRKSNKSTLQRKVALKLCFKPWSRIRSKPVWAIWTDLCLIFERASKFERFVIFFAQMMAYLHLFLLKIPLIYNTVGTVNFIHANILKTAIIILKACWKLRSYFRWIVGFVVPHFLSLPLFFNYFILSPSRRMSYWKCFSFGCFFFLGGGKDGEWG